MTLAQIVRLLVLARGLDPSRYEVHFATSGGDPRLLEGEPFRLWSIEGSTSQAALRAASQGRLPSHRVLRRHLAADLALFEAVQPDLVVGDLRLSLTTSAPLAGLPLLTLINAYWSPNRVPPELPMPEHPLVRLFGVKHAEPRFRRYAPAALRFAARPLNALRREHGLPELGDLPRALLWGTRTLFPDVPELVPLSELSPGQVFLGPVLWSPRVEPPSWWSELDGEPLVYVTLGSSGDLSVLPAVLAALEALPVKVMLATAGREALDLRGPKVYGADFLPGDEAARRARFVVTNGGSSTGYQALREGRPVLGLPSNLDQYLAMSAIERFGAGILVRAGTATPDQIGLAARRLLEDARYRAAATRAERALAALDPHERFEACLNDVFERAPAQETTPCP